MLEYRERNGNKHIVSDNELNAFAWAGYYANYSTILINGKNYEVVHVTDSEIEFADGTYLPFGCYAIFKSDDEVKFFDDYKLREVRKGNPLEHEYYCFNDDQFLKIAWWLYATRIWWKSGERVTNNRNRRVIMRIWRIDIYGKRTSIKRIIK